MSKDNLEEKLITSDVDDIRKSEFSKWQMNPGIASIRFSETSSNKKSDGLFNSLDKMDDSRDDGDTESVRRFRAESLSS